MLVNHIRWPSGLKFVERKGNSFSHGDVWVVEDVSADSLKELRKTREKCLNGIKSIKEQLDVMSNQLHEKEKSEEQQFIDLKKEFISKQVQCGLLDPSEMIIDDKDEEIIEAQVRESKKTLKSLLGLLQKIEAGIQNLENSKIHNSFEPCTVPDSTFTKRLVRVDKPFSDFKKQESDNGSPFTRPRESKTVPNNGRFLFCVKTFLGVSVPTDAKTKSNFVQESQRALRNIEYHYKKLQESEIFEGKGSKINCIMPIFAIHTLDLIDSKLTCLGLVMPFCHERSIDNVIRNIGGKKAEFCFEEDLVLNNLKHTIASLATLADHGIPHGNIKPPNLFISDNGLVLILSDFLAPTIIRKWLTSISEGLSTLPEMYFSPELAQRVLQKDSLGSQLSSMDVSKHDVFCLGLLYFYIVTLTQPKDAFRSRKKLHQVRSILKRRARSSQLLEIILAMLTYSSADRPSFRTLARHYPVEASQLDSLMPSAEHAPGGGTWSSLCPLQ